MLLENIILPYGTVLYDLLYYKTNDWFVHLAKTQISPVFRSVWSVFVVWMKTAGVLSHLLSAQRRNWSVIAVFICPICPAVAYESEHFVLISNTGKFYTGVKYMHFLACNLLWQEFFLFKHLLGWCDIMWKLFFSLLHFKVWWVCLAHNSWRSIKTREIMFAALERVSKYLITNYKVNFICQCTI